MGIREIAEQAGVSVATVSRTFNAPETVSPVLRERVLEVARGAGYVPNAAARQLASTRNWRIGAVIPTISNNVFADFIEALGEGLSGQGYSLLIATYEFDASRETKAIEGMLAAGVEGLILSGLEHDPQILATAEARGVSLLMTSILDRSGRWPTVGYDNQKGGRMIAGRVLELGHREVGIVAGEKGINDRVALRLWGVLEALEEAGVKPAIIAETPLSIPGGRAAMARVLDGAPDVTAVLCVNDSLAAGALFEAQARGISVPGELSITGFDGSVLATCTAPALTTIRSPIGDMGRAAAREIAALISGQGGRSYPVELPVVIVEGESTGPALRPLARFRS